MGWLLFRWLKCTSDLRQGRCISKDDSTNVYYKKAEPKPLQTLLTLWWVQGRCNFSNWWDLGFRCSPCCNFLGKDTSLTRCCWLPLWGKKKTQVTDAHYPILFSTSLYQGHWNKEIQETCLISKGHNPSPQKKQGSIEA